MLGFFRYIVIFAVVSLHAEIVWKGESLFLTATPFDKRIQFAYEFENKGTNVVEILQPKATCVCTVATLKKNRYAPGDKGELTGFYNINNRRGVNSVTIKVKGEELDGEIRRPFEDVLLLKVFIPEIATVVPSITLWQKGGEAVGKKIRIEVNQEVPLPLALVEVSSSVFTVELSEINPGRLYDLTVTPLSTEKPAQGIVTLRGFGSDQKPINFFAHLIVR